MNNQAMKISTLLSSAAVLAVGGVMLLPGWLEVSRARDAVANFTREARSRQVESKVVVSIKEIENPFTWFGGKPTLVVARKPVDGNFLVLYSDLSEGDSSNNKALVSADCSRRTVRVVSQRSYEKFLGESGYSILGGKLPSWNAAGYDSMLAVLVSQESVQAGSNVLFSVACNWDQYRTGA